MRFSPGKHPCSLFSGVFRLLGTGEARHSLFFGFILATPRSHLSHSTFLQHFDANLMGLCRWASVVLVCCGVLLVGVRKLFMKAKNA